MIKHVGNFGVQRNGAGTYTVIRVSDGDDLGWHATERAAWYRVGELDCGRIEAPAPRVERVAQLAGVPTEILTATLERVTDTGAQSRRMAQDIRDAIATR